MEMLMETSLGLSTAERLDKQMVLMTESCSVQLREMRLVQLKGTMTESRSVSLLAAKMVLQRVLLMEMNWVLQKVMGLEQMTETLMASNLVYSTDVWMVM